jgi:hypothetical protein
MMGEEMVGFAFVLTNLFADICLAGPPTCKLVYEPIQL